MTAQPMMGLGSDAIPACYVPANHRLWMGCYHSCNAVKTLPIIEPTEAQKDKEGEGRDFSGSLA